jgi:hypothetical protein
VTAAAGALLVACSGGNTFDELFAAAGNTERPPDSGAKSDGWTLQPPADAPTDAHAFVEANEGASDRAPSFDATTPSLDVANRPDAAPDDAAPDAPYQPVLHDAGNDAAPDPGDPLRGQRWEVKCTTGPLANDARLCSSMAPGLTACPENHRPSDKHITFGGRPGTHYLVTLRLRGVVELKAYGGGTPAGSHFQIGGTSPVDVVNAYAMSVSSPAQTYYVNADHTGGGQVIAALDDTVTIPVDAGATIELFATDSDCIQLRNCVDPAAAVCTPYVIPGVSPAPHAFDGQFAQVDVVSVEVQANL